MSHISCLVSLASCLLRYSDETLSCETLSCETLSCETQTDHKRESHKSHKRLSLARRVSSLMSRVSCHLPLASCDTQTRLSLASCVSLVSCLVSRVTCIVCIFSHPTHLIYNDILTPYPHHVYSHTLPTSCIFSHPTLSCIFSHPTHLYHMYILTPYPPHEHSHT